MKASTVNDIGLRIFCKYEELNKNKNNLSKEHPPEDS